VGTGQWRCRKWKYFSTVFLCSEHYTHRVTILLTPTIEKIPQTILKQHPTCYQSASMCRPRKIHYEREPDLFRLSFQFFHVDIDCFIAACTETGIFQHRRRHRIKWCMLIILNINTNTKNACLPTDKAEIDWDLMAYKHLWLYHAFKNYSLVRKLTPVRPLKQFCFNVI